MSDPALDPIQALTDDADAIETALIALAKRARDWVPISGPAKQAKNQLIATANAIKAQIGNIQTALHTAHQHESGQAG